jgi:predicted small lipoprotein YifL
MYKLKTSVLWALILAGLAACGQKGPLYLPDGAKSAAPAEVEEQQEEEDGAQA